MPTICVHVVLPFYFQFKTKLLNNSRVMQSNVHEIRKILTIQIFYVILLNFTIIMIKNYLFIFLSLLVFVL